MPKPLERYETFQNIDCVGKCERVMEVLRPHIEAAKSPFWAYFLKSRERSLAAGLDDLRVLHSYVHTIRELLMLEKDEHALELLHDLEETCM